MQQGQKLMTDSDLKAALENREAVVVHFSHHALMLSGSVFPEDLQNAIQNKDKWALSCSVLWPGHKMKLCGDVGVIFQPTVASVLSVSNADSGSYAGSDGTDYSAGYPLDMDTFESTFEVNGDYNEWRVKGADVAGIFIHNPNCVLVKKEMPSANT